MKKVKWFFTAFMCVAAIAVISVIPLTAQAETSGTCGDNLTWKLDDSGTLVISGTDEMGDYGSSTPWHDYAENITEVVISDGVTSIGYYAFYSCESLETVTIAESVTSIGDSAFSKCSSLKNITIPESVISIGTYAFRNTAYYNDEDNWEDDCLYIDTWLIETKYNSKMTEHCVKAGTVHIAEHAMSSLQYCTSIILPDSVKTIDGYAFSSCSNLTSVMLPEGVESIESGAFYACKNLAKITIPQSVIQVGSSTFSECPLLTTAGPIGGGYDIEFGWVDSIPNEAFCYCYSLESVVIPNGITSIGDYAFFCCSNIADVVVPDGVTSIGEFSFYECSSLISITIPQSVINVGHYAFSECPLLTTAGAIGSGCNIELGKLTILPDYVFSYCDGLTSVSIPNSVTSIGAYAFYDCDNLTSITIPLGVTSVGISAFAGCPLLKTAGVIGSGCNIEFGKFEALPDYMFACCENLTSVSMPNGVTGIGDHAFYNCSSLSTVIIPESVIYIGKYAFSGCSALSVVDYSGSVFDWSNISIEYGNSTLNNVYGLYAHGVCGNDLMWAIRSGVLTISGTGTMTSYSTSSKAPWYTSREQILSVIITEGVTSISNYAFYGCNNITSVLIPNSVTRIGSSAFYECSSLENIEIPNGVTSINDSTFYNCSSLANIIIPDSVITISNTAFSNTAYYNDESNWADDVLYINKHLIQAKSSIVNADIKSGTLTIADYAFYKCSSLKSISIPQSVTTIGDNAFSGCNALTTVYYDGSDYNWIELSIGDGNSILNTAYGISYGDCGSDLLWILKNGALTISGTGNMTIYTKSSQVPWYDNRTSILSVVISNGVTNITDYAFYGCSKLTSISIPDSVVSIGDYAFFNCEALDNITLPNNITEIGSHMFYHCSSLTKVIIPDGVIRINDYAFCGCTSLLDVTIPDSLKSIGEVVFADCSSLKTITIPSKVTSIGSSTFSGCSSLMSITIPENVTSIDDSLFDDCIGLAEITIPDGVMTIGSFAFSNCSSLTNIAIPESVISIGSSTFSGCIGLTEVTIPNNVKSIGRCAFYDCSALNDIVISDSVINIESYAFDGTAYYNDTSNWDDDGVLYIGNHLIKAKATLKDDYDVKKGTLTIADYAFLNCINLTGVTMPNSVRNIGNYAFENCNSLTIAAMGTGVAQIGEYAFKDCSWLAIVTIPNNVTSIRYRAFYDCDNLTDIYYSGDENDWEELMICSGNSNLYYATIHYNYIYPMNETFSAIGTYENAAEAEVVVTDGGEVTVKVKITNKKKLSTSKVAVYVVSYGSGGVKDIEELSKKTASSSVTFTGNVSGSYKIFIWDKNMCPITEDVG